MCICICICSWKMNIQNSGKNRYNNYIYKDILYIIYTFTYLDTRLYIYIYIDIYVYSRMYICILHKRQDPSLIDSNTRMEKAFKKNTKFS